MGKKQKYYVVWQGSKPGIYTSWTECQLQIKGYPDARYKAFDSREEAESAFAGNFSDHYQHGAAGKKTPASRSVATNKDIVWDSLSVDAACSGNPGAMEYQGVDTRTKAPIFHQQFELGTNNIGEFLAIVHALAMLKKAGKHTPIYTDSRTALAWVRNKRVKTNLKRTPKTAFLFELIERAENWLKANTYTNPLLKWETEKWGEIPADFGRK